VTRSGGRWGKVCESIVYEAEKYDNGLFHEGEPSGMGKLGYFLLLREGSIRWPLFVLRRIK
jgi:hypothetical protein